MATTSAISGDVLADDKLINGSQSDEMERHRDMWTTWFNVDDPITGFTNGDFETVNRIQRTNTICSKDYEIAAVQCRIDQDQDSVFDKDTPRSSQRDIFQRYCTTEGLICRNDDQIPSGLCQNYNIRFRCHYNGDNDGSDNFFPQFDVRIYIILAVVPILIFLVRILWAYVFRRRRQQRRNERRARRRLNAANGEEIDDDSSSVTSGVANPPPSYQELFGKTGHVGTGSSVFAISRDNIPICSKCESESCSVASILGKHRSLENAEEDGQNTPNELDPTRAETVLRNEADAANERNTRSAENAESQDSASPSTIVEDTATSVPASEGGSDETQINATEAPSFQESTVDVPSSQESMIEKPLSHENTVDVPLFQESTIEKPLSQENTVDVPLFQESTIEKPLSQENTVDVPLFQESTIEKPLSQENTVDVPLFQEITIEVPSAQENTAETPSPQETTIEAHPVHDTTNLHNENVNSDENPSESDSSTPENMQASTSETSMSETDLTLSLNPSLLNPCNISQPCACPCHRTIPLNGQATAGLDNQGFTIEADEIAANRHIAFPGMHIPVFGIQRAWSNASVASSVTQTELPTYDIAVELMTTKKKKEADVKPSSN